MIRTAVLGALIAISPAAALAQTEYRPASLFHGGYRDRVIENGFWRVTAGLDKESSFGAVANMALYRAAELARAEGYPFIQIVWHRVRMTYRQRGRVMDVVGYSAELKVRGARSAADPVRCEMRAAASCLVHPVERVLARLGPTVLAQR